MIPRPVVFVHGMYMTPLCWEPWEPYFEARGFRCVAPDFKEFPGRTHFIIGQRGWEEVAGFVVSWLAKRAPRAPDGGD